jgi:hypothetical protein
MIKHLLAGVAAAVLMSGVASAEDLPSRASAVDASRSAACRLFAR